MFSVVCRACSRDVNWASWAMNSSLSRGSNGSWNVSWVRRISRKSSCASPDRSRDCASCTRARHRCCRSAWPSPSSLRFATLRRSRRDDAPSRVVSIRPGSDGRSSPCWFRAAGAVFHHPPVQRERREASADRRRACGARESSGDRVVLRCPASDARSRIQIADLAVGFVDRETRRTAGSFSRPSPAPASSASGAGLRLAGRDSRALRADVGDVVCGAAPLERRYRRPGDGHGSDRRPWAAVAAACVESRGVLAIAKRSNVRSRSSRMRGFDATREAGDSAPLGVDFRQAPLPSAPRTADAFGRRRRATRSSRIASKSARSHSPRCSRRVGSFRPPLAPAAIRAVHSSA